MALRRPSFKVVELPAGSVAVTETPGDAPPLRLYDADEVDKKVDALMERVAELERQSETDKIELQRLRSR